LLFAILIANQYDRVTHQFTFQSFYMEVAEIQSSVRPIRKAEQILAAAGELFREHGYAATSMDAVAQRADVSKATLYVYFSGKRELFAAVITEEGERHSRSVITGEAGQEELRAKLLRFAHAIVELLIAPETVASYRMVAAEATRFPELGRDYYENGAARLLKRLEDFFTGAMASGKLRTAHPRRAAEQFIGLVRGDLQLRAMLGLKTSVSRLQQDAVIRAGVDTFCRAYLLTQEHSAS
jgi:TetR/AcrR family transcriptional regulator, mexJK operon transcriptional repressor